MDQGAAMNQILVTDWFRLLWDMVQRGHSINEISRRTGIAHSTLIGYHEGSQPPHWRGELLIELWCGVCAQARVDVPTTHLCLSPRVVRPAAQVQADVDAMAELTSIAKGWRAQA
jgi:hypothetical protein